MIRFRQSAAIVATLFGATLLFWAVLHQISAVWLDVALRPEVAAALERSMEDQKRLRALDPEHAREYRRQFEETRRLLSGIEVVRLNRQLVLRRFELALVVAFVIAAISLATALWLRQRRARERERSDYLTRLTALQETARRHAHEIKGPLTAARLELERYADAVRAGGAATDLARIEASIAEELDRLARYTREVSSFGSVGAPALRRESLGAIVAEFCTMFAGAWPNLQLSNAGGDAMVCADRDMVRQVLVNLCTNSVHAGARSVVISIGQGGGSVAVDVRDDGDGIPPPLRRHVFDPYVTTRPTGDGMGLGLSISRKVMLDHGGDLQLALTSPSGTTFRLTFGDLSCN